MDNAHRKDVAQDKNRHHELGEDGHEANVEARLPVQPSSEQNRVAGKHPYGNNKYGKLLS